MSESRRTTHLSDIHISYKYVYLRNKEKNSNFIDISEIKLSDLTWLKKVMEASGTMLYKMYIFEIYHKT